MDRDRALTAFGIIALIIGVGAGYLMYTQPEGLNPDWPMWMALLAPAVFALGGLHMIAVGLGQPRLSSAMFGALLVCLWAIVNWAAFFTTNVQCLATLSFLGLPIIEWQPGETECRNSLRAIVAALDILVVSAVVFVTRSRSSSRRT